MPAGKREFPEKNRICLPPVSAPAIRFGAPRRDLLISAGRQGMAAMPEQNGIAVLTRENSSIRPQMKTDKGPLTIRFPVS